MNELIYNYKLEKSGSYWFVFYLINDWSIGVDLHHSKEKVERWGELFKQRKFTIRIGNYES